MYVIHNSSEKSKEYVSQDDLQYVTGKKIRKLIQQIKAQKILDPSLRCDDVITALEEFKYGSIKEKVGHLEFELERDPESFFILKTFSNNYPPYSTMRYYALKKDEKYEERRKVKFI